MKKKIAIQGIKGAFHEEAARSVFGTDSIIEPCITFQELIHKVSDGTVDAAVMAIENTISGTILSNIELIRSNDLQITGEINLRIQQYLGGVKGSTINHLKEVRSHYMALNQCRAFFRGHDNIQLIESPDTAMSMREVANKKDVTLGAIGSRLAIEEYGLECLAESIETDENNYTRFAVIERENLLKVGDKVSLSLTLPHHPGALSNVLSLLELIGSNLTKIESTPVVGKPFQYRFFIDFILSTNVGFETTLEVLRPLIDELHILGRYHSEKS